MGSNGPEKEFGYKDLVKLLDQSDPQNIYEELIKKETRVLDTIDRVVNYSNEKQVKESEFLENSLNGIAHDFFWNMRLVMTELYDVKTFQDIVRVLTKDDRKIYLGILAILVGLFLFFIVNTI